MNKEENIILTSSAGTLDGPPVTARKVRGFTRTQPARDFRAACPSPNFTLNGPRACIRRPEPAQIARIF
ncbi:hypothetical protein L484_023668 [Morus notabilis]|uniref:Uncharacterized protein n=1 Tax=Morus notabilis TaxID=981085 RepID=W9RDU5_9ROSA|nr:hypothetical protein L484_023668 [Morus notabilis]